MHTSKSGGVTIRKARMSDYNSLIKLWKENEIVIRPGDDRDGIKRFLARNPNLSLVAVEGDKIIGAVLGSWDGRRGWLHHLAVEKGYRRKGAASMLVSEAGERMKKRGIGMVKVEIHDGNTASKALFTKLGFARYEKVLTFGKRLSK